MFLFIEKIPHVSGPEVQTSAIQRSAVLLLYHICDLQIFSQSVAGFPIQFLADANRK